MIYNTANRVALSSLLVICFLLISFLSGCSKASDDVMVFPGDEWTRPEESLAKKYEKKLKEAKAFSEELKSSSVMIVKNGVAIAEWGDTKRVSNLHSCRKSLLSALIGIAVERKQIDLAKTLQDLGIDDNEPSLTAEEKSATVHDLLKARSGIYHPALYETASMKARRPLRWSHAPGTFWYYNNWDFNTLGTIYEQCTGTGIFNAFEQEIARPLGMQDFTAANGSYVSGKDSIHPAYPFNMSGRDLARFALLYLNHGRWKDKQIIPAHWVDESVTPYSLTETGGYGYLWWTNTKPDGSADTLPGSYYAAGSGGQAAYVVPSMNLVVVHRVDTSVPGFIKVTGLNIRELVEKIVTALKR